MTEHTIMFLTMLSAAVTGPATIGLTVFAVLAWNAATKNLNLMEQSNEATNRAVKATIDSAEANTAVIIEGRQIAALSDYSSALMEILGNLAVKGYPMKDQVQKALSLGISWTIHHPEATGQTAVVIDYQTDLSTVLRHTRSRHSASDPVNWEESNVPGYLHTLLSHLFAWQLGTHQRDALSKALKDGMGQLKREAADAARSVKENPHG